MSFHVCFCSMIDPCALFYLCVALRGPADASTAALPLTLARPAGRRGGLGHHRDTDEENAGAWGGGGRDGGRRA
jgi:hypothetical protein